MTTDACDRVLVTLNAPPTLEEGLVDWLLARDTEQGFTQSDAYGHGARHEGLTVAEQVRGRRKRVRFDISLEAATLDAFIGELRERFARADIYYRVVPVIEEQHLG